jgi:hypothetical protein
VAYMPSQLSVVSDVLLRPVKSPVVTSCYVAC